MQQNKKVTFNTAIESAKKIEASAVRILYRDNDDFVIYQEKDFDQINKKNVYKLTILFNQVKSHNDQSGQTLYREGQSFLIM